MYITSPLWGPFGIGAYMFALFGVFFLALWWRDREPGVQLIGLSILMTATFYVLESMGKVTPPDRYCGPPWAVMLVASAIALWSFGLAQFLEPRLWWRRASIWLVAGPQLVLIALMIAGVPVLRVLANLAYMWSFLAMAIIIWRARKVEPGAGYGLVAISLAVMPIVSIGIIASGIDLIFLRYVSIPTLLLFDMTLLVVCLHRRRQRLETEMARRTEAEAQRQAANAALVAANALLEQKVAQRTEALNDMVAGLTSFNRNISHDLRGPLGGIEAMAQRAQQSIIAGQGQDAIRRLGLIENEARRSRELVAALLDLAWADNLELHRAQVPLGDVAREVINALKTQAAYGRMPPIEVDALPTVEADRSLLRAVFTNLISNACKFLGDRPNGRVEIGQKLCDGELAFFVRDNGPGFASEAASQLFTPFRRLHGASVAGHGIGLSIVRRAIERHGGKVWAEAEPGQGATFFFTLPQSPQLPAMADARPAGVVSIAA